MLQILAKYCPPHVDPANGFLYPPRCTQTKHNVFNDSCIVHCNPGYVPRVWNSTKSLCREDGTWDMDVFTECIPPTHDLKNVSTTERNSQHSVVTEPSVTTPQTTSQSIRTTHSNSVTKNITVNKWEATTVGGRGHMLVTLAVSGGRSSSIGRVIAGSICGGVVALGVLFIVCISHCRKDRAKKNTGGFIDRSKSLEQLVAGSFNYEVQYSAIKTDANPLYESIESPPTELPERITDNVLYESVCPLFPDDDK